MMRTQPILFVFHVFRVLLGNARLLTAKGKSKLHKVYRMIVVYEQIGHAPPLAGLSMEVFSLLQEHD
jgi:hypothetical protein